MSTGRITCLLSICLLLIAVYLGWDMPGSLKWFIHGLPYDWYYPIIENRLDLAGGAAILLLTLGTAGFVLGILVNTTTRYIKSGQRWTIVVACFFLLAYGMYWTGVGATIQARLLHDQNLHQLSDMFEVVVNQYLLLITALCLFGVAISIYRSKPDHPPAKPLLAILPGTALLIVQVVMLIMGMFLTIFIPLQLTDPLTPDLFDPVVQAGRIDSMVFLLTGVGVMLELTALLLAVTVLLLPGRPKESTEAKKNEAKEPSSGESITDNEPSEDKT